MKSDAFKTEQVNLTYIEHYQPPYKCKWVVHNWATLSVLTDTRCYKVCRIFVTYFINILEELLFSL